MKESSKKEWEGRWERGKWRDGGKEEWKEVRRETEGVYTVD